MLSLRSLGMLLGCSLLPIAKSFTVRREQQVQCHPSSHAVIPTVARITKPRSALFGLSTRSSFAREESIPVSTATFDVEEISQCIGSGSYGTVHLVTVVDQRSGERVKVVGKRAWTEPELREQHAALSREQIKDKATRCRYYWSVEKHCFGKMEQANGIPTYRGTGTDVQQRNWMLFDILEASSPLGDRDNRSSDIALSLQEMMERDLADPRQDGEHHHLHSTSQALLLGDDHSLTATLDVVLDQLLEILTHVHAHSIVHRDLKPSNLLIASRDGVSRLVLIDFGSAGDLSTRGLLKENIGLSSRVAISPIYAAPEVFVDPSDPCSAVNFDCFSAALLYCQLLFQYLDERTESGFHQQLANAQWDLDVWLQSALQSKVRPAGLEDALQVLEDRPGLWKLLQDILRAHPADRLSSKAALERWRKVLDNALSGGARLASEDLDPDLNDGPYLLGVLESLQVCEIPTVWPLHFVASFQRKASLGLYLAESDADTSDMDEASIQKWKQATADAAPGDVFVQGIVPGGQAAKMEVFAIGDRLQGVGELPLAGGGFERAVEMIQDQPISAEYVVLHFDRKSALIGENNARLVSVPSLVGPIQLVDQGAWSIKGRRKAQEDAFILHEVHDTNERSIILGGVFDGHLGAAASSFVQNYLPVTFSSSLNLGDGAPVQSLLEIAWNQCCDSYRASCLSADECVAEYDPKEGILMAYTGSQNAVAGTTATVFALDKQTSHLAALNCGDSRGIVIDSNGHLVFQTVDHKPEIEIERLAAGTKQGLEYSLPKCRVTRWTLEVGDYDYAVARSLEGPFATSKGIVSSADVSVLPAEPGTTALIATDGLWEVIDSEEACRIVSRLKSQRTSAGDAAKALCSLAYEKATSDNVSVVILYLD